MRQGSPLASISTWEENTTSNFINTGPLVYKKRRAQGHEIKVKYGMKAEVPPAYTSHIQVVLGRKIYRTASLSHPAVGRVWPRLIWRRRVRIITHMSHWHVLVHVRLSIQIVQVCETIPTQWVYWGWNQNDAKFWTLVQGHQHTVWEVTDIFIIISHWKHCDSNIFIKAKLSSYCNVQFCG